MKNWQLSKDAMLFHIDKTYFKNTYKTVKLYWYIGTPVVYVCLIESQVNKVSTLFAIDYFMKIRFSLSKK